MSETLQALLAGILLASGIGVGLLLYLTGILRKFIKGLDINAIMAEYDRMVGEQNKPLATVQNSADTPNVQQQLEWNGIEIERLRKEVFALGVRLAVKDRRIAQLESDLADAKDELQKRNNPGDPSNKTSME